jgi:hypothetical protein
VSATTADLASAGRRPSAPSALRRTVAGAVEGTPGRLRLLGVLSVIACLLFGVCAVVGASVRSSALSDAKSAATQLVRVETIRTNLVAADASLTNAFLVGGLEPTAERRAYETGISTASTTLAQASGADSRDAAVLAKVNGVITNYTGLVESARANNRQGFPVGAAYLREATQTLHDDALPALQSLGDTEQKRVDSAYSAGVAAAVWVVVGLVIALLVLGYTSFWLWRRTKRLLNVGVVSGAVVVLVVGALMLGVLGLSQSRADKTRSGAYFATLELASARIDAFDAKSQESLTLINRGSGQANEATFQNLAANATAVLADASARGGAFETAAKGDLAAYLSVHKQIRALDDAGNWDQAVALATSTARTANANTTFAALDSASAQGLDTQSAKVSSELTSADFSLVLLGWFALVFGVAAAVASWRGIATRAKEYR